MATVANLDGHNVRGGTSPTDVPLTKHNREGSGDPNSSITPTFVGEIYLDTDNSQLWQAQDATNDSWVPALRVT